MKKLVTIMLAVTILFAVATSAFAQKSVAGKKIGFVNAGPDDYYAQFGKTLVAVAKSYGMTVTELNSNYKPEQELANVQDFVREVVVDGGRLGGHPRGAVVDVELLDGDATALRVV